MRTWVLMFSVGLLGASSASAEPVGMILRVNGEVTLERGSQVLEALPGEVLEVGDRIDVRTGELFLTFCPESGRFRVGPGTGVEITADRVQPLRGSDLSLVGSNPCSLPKVRLGKESLERVGALRPRGKPPIAVFLGGPVSTARPRFEWSPIDSSDRYQVRLLDEMGTRLWEAETDQTFLDFPSDQASLAEGWYSWDLTSFEKKEILAQQSTGFEVRPSAEFASPYEVELDLLLPAAFAFEAEGYFAEAAACLRRFLEAESDDDRLRRRLAWLYWKAGLLIAFNAEMETR